ncbi:MAG: ankyrin repeat domain-containing protein [Abitibacteriaceae bacterium]|nr:ankyrin repeat domain-containing protein [Abditibacteriaceae bacterium]
MIPKRMIALALPVWVLIQTGVSQAEPQTSVPVQLIPGGPAPIRTPQPPPPPVGAPEQPPVGPESNAAGQPSQGGQAPRPAGSNQASNANQAPDTTPQIPPVTVPIGAAARPSDNPPFPQFSTVPPINNATKRDYDLMLAAFDGETSRVRDLLAQGAGLEARDWKYGFTPLHWASENGHLGTVRYLLSKGAKVDVRSYPNVRVVLGVAPTEISTSQTADNQNFMLYQKRYLYTLSGHITPLMMACAGGYGLTVRELLNKGANANGGSGSLTPLACAAFSGYMPAVQALLDKGARVNDARSHTSPALMNAVFRGATEVVKALLDRGAIAYFKDDHGYTPRMFAQTYGFTSIARLLKHAEDVQSSKAAQAKVQTIGHKPTGITADAHASDMGIIIIR